MIRIPGLTLGGIALVGGTVRTSCRLAGQP
jgi:hypothetical protein